jgi:hypothetical protein
MRSALPLLTLLLPIAAAAADPRYAVTSSSITGPKGSIGLIQVSFVGPPASEAKCQGSLQADRNTRGVAVIEKQECLVELPASIAPAEKGQPLPGSYVVFWRNSFLLYEVRGMHVVSYAFDPGPPQEVCDRWLSRFKQLDSGATCIQPAETGPK